MLEAFQPQGNTMILTVTTTGTPAVQPSTGSIMGARIANLGGAIAYFAIGQSSTTFAVLPSSGTPANGIPIASGGVETFNLGPNFYLSAITSAGTATLSITPGFGA